MKTLKILVVAAFLLFLIPSCAYQRIGDLNLISNRNINTSQKYVIIERNVTATAKMKQDDAMERAVDNAVESVKGEYMMNVKVAVKDNGKKIRVIGDVWGTPEQKKEYDESKK